MADESAGSFDPFRSQNLEARLRHIEDFLVRASFSGERDSQLSQGQGQGTVVIVSDSEGDSIPEERVDWDEVEGHNHDGAISAPVTLRGVDLATNVGTPTDGDILTYDTGTGDWESRQYINNRLGIKTGGSPDAILELGAGTNVLAPLQFNAGTRLNSPIDGSLGYDGTRFEGVGQHDWRSFSLSSDHKITTTTVVNTTTLTTVYTGTIGTASLDGQQTVILELYGRYSTANGVDTLTINVVIGGTTIITLVTTAGVVTNAPILLRFVGTCRTGGGGGEIWGSLWASVNNVDKSLHNTTVTSVDLSLTVNPTWKVQWSNADAGNSFSVDQAFMCVWN